MANTVTLYIEDAEIKLLVSNGKQITKWASQMIPQKLVRDGVILDTEAVAGEIKSLFNITGTKENSVILALSGLNTIFRIITLPAGVPKSIIDEAITNEAQRVLPISMDQVYLAYQNISIDKDETHYYLVAHSKNATDALIKTVRTAGLKIQSLDLAPLALARCANEPRAVIVNSWLTYVDIVVMSGRIPQVIRTLSLPTDSVNIQDKLPFIAEEIERTISFYNSSFADKALDLSAPIMVCGDLSSDEEALTGIGRLLDNPISRLTPPFIVNAEFSSGQYMVNVGMVMKGRVQKGGKEHYSIIDINAIPPLPRPPSFSLKRVLIPVVIFAALLVLGWEGAMLWNSFNKTAQLISERDMLQSQIASINVDIANLNEEADELSAQSELIETEISDKTDLAMFLKELVNEQTEINLEPIEYAEDAAIMQQLLNGITAGMEKINTDMDVITVSNVNEIFLNLISYAKGESVISGIALTDESIFLFAEALQDSGQFITVDILNITFEDTSHNFDIKLTW